MKTKKENDLRGKGRYRITDNTKRKERGKVTEKGRHVIV